MILITIQGMSDGTRDVKVEVPVDKIEEILPEFFGNITLKGTLCKLSDRFTFSGEASCMAKLVCDRSLKEFDMLIEADISISFLRENYLSEIEISNEIAEFEKNVIKHDDKQLNITEEVIQRLTVSIPMKKIAPESEEADFNEIFPGKTGRITGEKTKIDDRWSELQKIKMN